MSDNQLTPVQVNYRTLQNTKGFDAYVKLFELAGNDPAQAKNLAEKELYHLATLMADSEDLRAMPPSALIMEMRKIPLQGVSLDPSLRLAYLIVHDKTNGKVSLEISGRGKAVQGIAQGIIKNVNAECIYEGDRTDYSAGIVKIIPSFKAGAKVIGGILTVQWSDGRVTQEFYRESHIAGWRSRSEKRFRKANMNYSSFNNGIEPGFMCSKMLKHKLDRIGINPFPGAYKRLLPDQLATLPADEAAPQVFTEDADVIDQPHETDAPAMEPPVLQSHPQGTYETDLSNLEL